MPEKKTRVGAIFTYFAKVNVAGIKLEDTLKVGDTISIEGHTTKIEQEVDSMEIDRKPVQEADKGAEVGIKVKDRVRPHDVVYKLG